MVLKYYKKRQQKVRTSSLVPIISKGCFSSIDWLVRDILNFNR
jgi:hypothetical protein